MNHLHRLFARRVTNLPVCVCICPKLNSYKWLCQFKHLRKCIALCSRTFSAVVIYALFFRKQTTLHSAGFTRLVSNQLGRNVSQF